MALSPKNPLSQADLCAYLERATGCPVDLILTDNRCRLLSVQREGRLLKVRLQRLFLQAGPELWRQIACFLRGEAVDQGALRAFYHHHPERPAAKRPQPRTPQRMPRGQHHHLDEIFDEINRTYFNGSMTAGITWGRRRKIRPARRRTLGSYSYRTGTIRIHPLLDRPEVPREVVAFIVYHEMLHADLGAPLKKGRRQFHSREFRSREKRFDGYMRAQRWLERQGFEIAPPT